MLLALDMFLGVNRGDVRRIFPKRNAPAAQMLFFRRDTGFLPRGHQWRNSPSLRSELRVHRVGVGIDSHI